MHLITSSGYIVTLCSTVNHSIFIKVEQNAHTCFSNGLIIVDGTDLLQKLKALHCGFAIGICRIFHTELFSTIGTYSIISLSDQMPHTEELLAPQL